MAGILGQNTAEDIIVNPVIKDVLLNEDDMISDSEKLAATQQSIKAYVDAEVQRAWHQILSSVTTFSVGDSNGDGNSTKITVNDGAQKITISATDINLDSSAIPVNVILASDAFNNIAKVVAEPTIVDADGTLADITTKFNTALQSLILHYHN